MAVWRATIYLSFRYAICCPCGVPPPPFPWAYRSIDGGASWQAIDPGLIPRSFVFRPASPSIVLAGGYDRVLCNLAVVAQSIDAGATWTSSRTVKGNGGLPFVPVQSLAVASSGAIYAGTAGAGVYATAGATMTIPTLELAALVVFGGLLALVGIRRLWS